MDERHIAESSVKYTVSHWCALAKMQSNGNWLVPPLNGSYPCVAISRDGVVATTFWGTWPGIEGCYAANKYNN